VDVVVAEVLRAYETHGVRFVIDRWLTTRGTADVGGLVLLADLTIAVGNDVPWVGVDTEEAGDLSEDAGLFQAFPDRALGSCFPDVLSCSKIALLSSTTSRLLAGMRLLALGACGS
jgi:hypothetical protein